MYEHVAMSVDDVYFVRSIAVQQLRKIEFRQLQTEAGLVTSWYDSWEMTYGTFHERFSSPKPASGWRRSTCARFFRQ